MNKHSKTDLSVAIPLVLILIGAAILVSGFTTMIGLGILHASLSPAIPAIGFGDSILTSIGLWLVIGGRSASVKASSN